MANIEHVIGKARIFNLVGVFLVERLKYGCAFNDSIQKGNHMSDFELLKTAMKAGKVADVRRLVESALAGALAQDILNGGLLEAMSEVGQRFKRNEVFVPEVPVAARAMKAGTELL